MIAAAALWTALLTAGLADDPDTEPATVSSRATDAVQDAAALRPRVVRWRQQLQPGYPTAERTKGWPAQHCRCVFTLGADGVPKQVEVTECAPPFQEAATRALMDWRTYPLDVESEGEVVMALVQVDFAVPGSAGTPQPSPAASAPQHVAPSPTRAAPQPEGEDARLARVRAESDSLARDIAADKAAFEDQVIESDWYGRERVAVVQWLLDQAAATATFEDGGAVILLPSDRADLARRLGTSVGVLQRVLHVVNTLGGATVHGDVVVVRDTRTLTRLLGAAR